MGQKCSHERYQYRVMSVIAILDSMKFSRFLHKNKSDYTFIKKYVAIPRGLHDKITLYFPFDKQSV